MDKILDTLAHLTLAVAGFGLAYFCLVCLASPGLARHGDVLALFAMSAVIGFAAGIVGVWLALSQCGRP